MSLVDIGTNDNRTNPMPNNHDVLKEKPADGTTSWSQKYKVNKRFYTKNPLQSGDIIQVISEEKPKWKKVDDEFIKTGETEIVLKAYRKIT